MVSWNVTKRDARTGRGGREQMSRAALSEWPGKARASRPGTRNLRRALVRGRTTVTDFPKHVSAADYLPLIALNVKGW